MRDIAAALCLAALVAPAPSGHARPAMGRVTVAIGPMRLLSPQFGYAVAYRTVEHGDTAETTTRLFLYDHGRWRNITPRDLPPNGIDDVAFVDRRHAWVAAYDCGAVAVYVYRTSDGGRSWQFLGKPGYHSCGGGPTYLSFVDTRNGWMEPVSPNGPGGELQRTRDGGATWSHVASLLERGPAIPCLAPIVFTTPSTGWTGCRSNLYVTTTGGKAWRARQVPLPHAARNPVFGPPRFFGHSAVEAATLGDLTTASAVTFARSVDGGRSWSLRSRRSISSCAGRDASWPASVATSRTWWIVAGHRDVFVQVTSDGGRRWHVVAARGLPRRICAVLRVSAATARVAWVVAHAPGDDTALFETHDAGRTWTRVPLLHG